MAAHDLHRRSDFSAGASPDICRDGGRLLGRFHRAVSDLEHTFSNIRPGVHDTARHLRHLDDVLDTHMGDPAFREVEPVGRAILAAAAALEPLGELPPRIVHGDPKLNNIVFSPQGRALSFIDLDTLSRMTIPVELGDAFRSWCNPTGEDVVDARFDLALYAAGIEGYAEEARGFLTPAEMPPCPPPSRPSPSSSPPASAPTRSKRVTSAEPAPVPVGFGAQSASRPEPAPPRAIHRRRAP